MLIHSLFICQNQINYEIAFQIATSRDLIICEKGIITYKTSLAKHFRSSKRLSSLIKLLIKFNFFKCIYIPHHKVLTNRIIDQNSHKINYIDDGLDTLRVVPKNFTREIAQGQKYYTFHEYENLPIWFDRAAVYGVCSLDVLTNKKYKGEIRLPSEDFVVIESPNMDLAKILNYVGDSSVCYLVHRVPHKRLKNIPKEWRQDQFGALTESVIYGDYKGCVIAADTMTSVVLYLLSSNKNYKFLYVGLEIPMLHLGVPH